MEYASYLGDHVIELTAVGYEAGTIDGPNRMKTALTRSKIVLASLTIMQHTGESFLLAHGFKVLAGPVRNPNSGNQIKLYAWKPRGKVEPLKASIAVWRYSGAVQPYISCGIRWIYGVDQCPSALLRESINWPCVILMTGTPKTDKRTKELRKLGFRKVRNFPFMIKVK